jgi:DNA ligase-1
MLLAELVATSSQVTASRSRRRKTELLVACLRRLEPAEVALGAAYLAGQLPQGRVEVGWTVLAGVKPPPAERPGLRLLDVDHSLDELAGVRGTGSRQRRLRLLGALLAAATAEEQRFLRGLLLGELRQGALAGILAQAIAAAWNLPEADVRRALMLRGDLGAVAEAAARGGAGALGAIRLTLFQPLQPMLAQTATDLSDALADLGPAAVEWKLDGARVQVHRDGDRVRVYTRGLREVSASMPGVAAIAAGLPVDTVVLDGEALALGVDGRPRAFQETMRRFGSEPLVEPGDGVVLTPFFFDCLQLDGEDLLDRPLHERAAALDRVVPPANRVPRTLVEHPAQAEAALAEALARGHEGVMLKALAAPYEAGRRGGAWRKVKLAHTLDLVVLAAEWGSGRRRGWLSNLHLGARDPRGGGYVMLGKTFKGLTDALLAWQTERLLALEQRREGHVVHVRPELVVEVAFDGVQASPRYPGGVALRFARVRRYRQDKPAAEADTIDSVLALHRAATGSPAHRAVSDR